VSHTALVQTSVAAGAVQLPLSVGFVCGASLGSAVPFGSLAEQVWAVSLHQLPAVQSASTLQPPCGSQKPFELHTPERHTVAAFPVAPVVHGPSPFA
jgi:hypothetical protein